MAAGDLTTLTNAQAWLALAAPTSAQNATLARLISATSSRIQAWLGYQLVQADYTRAFDGVGGAKIMLPDRPVSAVSSVSVDGTSIPAAPGPGCAGFVFDNKSVALVGGYRFCRGFQNVLIAYTAGYASVPPDLEQACLEWVSGTFQSQLRDPALVSVKAGDQQETYSNGVAEAGGALIPMPASVLGALAPYRRVSL